MRSEEICSVSKYSLVSPVSRGYAPLCYEKLRIKLFRPHSYFYLWK